MISSIKCSSKFLVDKIPIIPCWKYLIYKPHVCKWIMVLPGAFGIRFEKLSKNLSKAKLMTACIMINQNRIIIGPHPRGGGGVLPYISYIKYRDVPTVRVSFSGSSVLNRVYNVTFLSLKTGSSPQIFSYSPPLIT